ncbi:fibroblast growth factor-binding protein 1 [Trichomycterus rosablanca]|uniref:fibroblast growth factor-binding protein 1 n=1 Tax=Trichomycterus rosablanca TaxID=2290929 RepID=UPI002F3610C0
MQFSTALFFVLLLFLLAASEARKKPKQQKEKSPNSGKLRTRKGHQCTWETQERENNFLLSLNCSAPSEEAGLDTPASYQCQFSGKPNECAAFRDKPEQYWKEVLTKLKKREKVCDGGKALKVRMCRKAPGFAHLKPVSDRKKQKKQKEVMMGDEGVRGEYCGDVWHPVCRFFQRFLSEEVH